MKTTKIKIKNLFGISETELDGQSVEITGTNGAGKTSVIDAIRYALTNRSDRSYVLKKGENEGEIIIETDSGLYIDRKKRSGQADYKSIKEGGRDVPAPESFLQSIFTPLQIDPVRFIALPEKEQNRIILDMIDFDWDLSWIKEQFGEIPSGVDYQQNILQVLSDIQSDHGDYFIERQDIQREMRHKRAFIEDIAKDIPEHFDAEKWDKYDVGGVYSKITEAQRNNNLIDRARAFMDSYNNKVRGYEAEKEIELSNEKSRISAEKESLIAEIERKKAEIKAAEEKLSTENRQHLYEKCKEKGLQFIATRTTDGELEVNYL